jgi:hypothetical protein
VARLKYLGTALTNENYVDKEIQSRLNKEIPACYHLAQNLLSSLLPKILKITMYRTIIFLLFCMGVKCGRSYYGKNKGSGCSRIGC